MDTSQESGLKSKIKLFKAWTYGALSKLSMDYNSCCWSICRFYPKPFLNDLLSVPLPWSHIQSKSIFKLSVYDSSSIYYLCYSYQINQHFNMLRILLVCWLPFLNYIYFSYWIKHDKLHVQNKSFAQAATKWFKKSSRNSSLSRSSNRSSSSTRKNSMSSSISCNCSSSSSTRSSSSSNN